MAVGGYFAYNYYQGEAKKKSEQIARKAARQEKAESKRVEVAQMVLKYNAVTDWEDKLCEGSVGKKKNKEKIFTVELEKLWLINSPILFKGRIKDVSTLDANNYLLTLDGLPKPGTQLALTLKSPKTMIDYFLRIHPKADFTVALIAKISKIDTKYRVTEEGYGADKSITEEKIITGVGQCMDILLYSESFYDEMLLEKKGL